MYMYMVHVLIDWTKYGIPAYKTPVCSEYSKYNL